MSAASAPTWPTVDGQATSASERWPSTSRSSPDGVATHPMRHPVMAYVFDTLPTTTTRPSVSNAAGETKGASNVMAS